MAGTDRYLLRLSVADRGKQSFTLRNYPWTGSAIPEGILLDAIASTGRALSEHVCLALGVQLQVVEDRS
jgi:hypothetical protein